MPQLPNYLRSHRKRLALSQDEVAFLLGALSGAKVCRYERFIREPALQTALAFEVIFQKSVSEIFAGLYRRVEQQVAARARVLTHKSLPQKQGPRSAHKHKALAKLVVASVKKPNP